MADIPCTNVDYIMTTNSYKFSFKKQKSNWQVCGQLKNLKFYEQQRTHYKILDNNLISSTKKKKRKTRRERSRLLMVDGGCRRCRSGAGLRFWFREKWERFLHLWPFFICWFYLLYIDSSPSHTSFKAHLVRTIFLLFYIYSWFY